MSAKPKRYTLAEAKIEMDRLSCERRGHKPPDLFDLITRAPGVTPTESYVCKCGAYRWSAAKA